MSRYEFPEITPEIIEECKDWLAWKTAQLDQRKKMFEDQYPMRHPFDNRQRLWDLEATEFRIEMNRNEMEGYIKDMESEEES